MPWLKGALRSLVREKVTIMDAKVKSSVAGNGPANQLGLLGAWALAFGCAVGWGAFVMPGSVFLPKAGPLGTALGVLTGGIVMAVIAWNYHFMMNRNPGPGGAYTYAKEAFGIDHGFLCAWFLALAYLAIVWANATALAVMARGMFGLDLRFGFHYRLAGFDVWFGDLLVADVAIAAAIAVNLRRRLAGVAQTALAAAFALGIAFCFAAALRGGGGFAAAAPAFSPQGGVPPLKQVLRIVALAPWLFVGFESISHASGEFRFPVRRSFGVLAAALVTSVLAYAAVAAIPALVPVGGESGWPGFAEELARRGGAAADPFDLVFTDMWMPNMDGEGLVKAIRADPALASMKVVAVTADVELQANAEELGFNGTLLKPVTSESLRNLFTIITTTDNHGTIQN